MNLVKIISICFAIFIVGVIISILLPLIKWAIIICLAIVLASIVYQAIMNIKNKKAIDDKIIDAQVSNERESKE